MEKRRTLLLLLLGLMPIILGIAALTSPAAQAQDHRVDSYVVGGEILPTTLPTFSSWLLLPLAFAVAVAVLLGTKTVTIKIVKE